MIQRIQSIFLLAASIIMLVLFWKPLAQLELTGNVFLFFHHNEIASADPATSFQEIPTWPVTIILLLIIGISLYTIFQFKNRIRQIRLCIFNIILQFGLVGLVYFFVRYTMNQEGGIHSAFLWPIVIPFISIILTYLALKRIQRDELLIKSIDRFRK